MILESIILGENDKGFSYSGEAFVSPDDKQRIAQQYIVPTKFSDDIATLTAYVGEASFQSGLCIEVSLGELLSILPRKRRRVDAYDSLRKYLSEERGITLNIKTNRKL